MPALVVPVRRSALTRYLLGSAAFVVTGGWLLGSGAVPAMLAGGLAVAFFGPLAAWFATALVRGRPGVVVDERGVTDHSSPLAAGLLPWHEVTWVAEGGAYVVLGVRSPAVLLAGAGPLARLLIGVNARATGSPAVRIPVALLPMTAAELSRAIAARAPDPG